MVEERNKRLKIAYLSAEDPRDKHAFSGSTYYMAQALQKHCGDVHVFGPIDSFEKRIIGRAINKGTRLFLRKNTAYDRLVFVAKKHAKIAARLLAGQPFDVIFAPVAAPEIAFLETDIPIVLIEDATFALLHNYYPGYSNLTDWSARQGNAIEIAAYKNASALLYSSEWAACSAIKDYQMEPQKIFAVPFGANLDSAPSRDGVLARKKSEYCRLLFIGIGWEKKGGEIAFETLLRLEEMGLPAELIICGSIPPARFTHERMRVIPFLDKNDESQQKELESLYETADFLLVPTRREAYGIVFCEASAYGLPSITTRTGGTSEVVRDGKNGFVLPYHARGKEYAEVIARIYRNDRRYAELVKSSRDEFEKRLNWDSWGTTVQQILRKIVPQI